MTMFVINIITELTDINIAEIDYSSTFEQLGFDTIDLAELVMNIEDKLEINANIDSYYSKTVSELVNNINKSK